MRKSAVHYLPQLIRVLWIYLDAINNNSTTEYNVNYNFATAHKTHILFVDSPVDITVSPNIYASSLLPWTPILELIP